MNPRLPKRILSAVNALALVSVMPLSAQTPAQVPSRTLLNLQAGKNQDIVIFGTSLSAGGAWVNLLKGYLNTRFPGLATLYNESGSGHSSKWGLQNITNVTRHKPEAVIIEFAMNDAYYPPRDGYTEGVTVDTCRINLNKIIDSVLASNPNAEVFLHTMDLPLGMPRVRRPRLEDYYDAYRQVAAARSDRLADHDAVWKSILDYDSTFYVAWVPDSLHPNAEGSGAITYPGVLSLLTGAKITLTSPAPQAGFVEGTDIVLQAQATTPVTRVDFYRGKTKIGSDNTSPYSFTWQGATAGKYMLMAKLVQDTFAVAVTAGVTVRVTKPVAISTLQSYLKAQATGSASSEPLFLPDGRGLPQSGTKAFVPFFAKPGKKEKLVGGAPPQNP